MDYEVKKAENCFADAENYEYRVATCGEQLLELLRLSCPDATMHINDRLRRPTFFAQLTDGQRIKGLLSKNIIKVGYVTHHAAEQKSSFESWLSKI